jgi:hypothetical protein
VVSYPQNLHRHSSRLLLFVAAALPVALTALLGRIGADSRWLAALGHAIFRTGSVPAGVPFASASSAHWPNALVLAELCFAALVHAFGDRGLLLAQLVAVAVAMTLLIRDARAAGASAGAGARALLIAAAGSLPALVIARVQLFSLILFPALLLLLRADDRRTGRAVWLVVPLLALWSNLHGVALLGLAVVLAYLVFSRARRDPWGSAALGVASFAALWLTPALLHTGAYYRGLVENLAAQRGVGMWGALALSSPLDLLLVGAALALAVSLRRRIASLPRWELAVGALLLLLTIRADRDGVWLLFFLVTPAALATSAAPARDAIAAPVWALALAPVALGAIVLGVLRGPVPTGASNALVAKAISRAHGSAVLAGGGIEEQVALAGGTIWAGDPIDAFSRSTQATYLDWLAGRAAALARLARQVRVVLVPRDSAVQRLMARQTDFWIGAADRNAILYERVGNVG